MISRFFPYPFLVAAATFAASDTSDADIRMSLRPEDRPVPAGIWIPFSNDPSPVSATVVVQDSATWLVTEFAGSMACAYPNFDSLVPFAEGRASLARVVWDIPMVKMDSASASPCKNVRRYRRIDRLPMVEVQTFGVPGPIRVAYAPDTVKFCRNGACIAQPTRKVRTPSTSSEQCLVGTLRPFDTHQQAVDFLQGKVAQSNAALRLRRRPSVLIRNLPPPILLDTLGKIVKCVEPLVEKSVVAPYEGWPSYLNPISSWNDPSVGSSYALPSPGNANDLHGVESLEFTVDTLLRPRMSNSAVPVVHISIPWSYSTGVEGYLYRGATNGYDKCGISGTAPTIFADTLATSGDNLLVTNAKPQCGRRDVDGYAASFTAWFALLPWTGEPLESVFRHYASVETDWSWPVEGDSILVRGQKVAISELQSTSGIANRQGTSLDFKVAVSGRSISVELGRAADLRVLDAVGHVLTRAALPSGRSLVSLPNGARGMLVVQANGNRKTVVVP